MKVKYFAIAMALLALGACNSENENGNEKKDNVTTGEALEKAASLKENTYVVQKVGGTAETRTLDQKWSSWESNPMTDPETDATTMCVALSLEDGDDEGMTLGGAYFIVPEDVIGEPQTIDSNFVWKHPSFHANVFTQKDQNASAGHDESNWLNAKVGMYQGKSDGNMKLGKCHFLVKTHTSKADPRPVLYQLLFYVEFTNHLYQFDETTQKEEVIEDGDYIIYGNGIIEKPVRSFTLKPNEFHLNYGMTNGQVLEVDYEPEDANWDWFDLEIDGETNKSFFNWYPATHNIAINQLAPGADHKDYGRQIVFRLKSNHSVRNEVWATLN